MGVGQRLADFGEDPNTNVQEVVPGSADDPFTRQPGSEPAPASAPPAGPDAAPPSSPEGSQPGTSPTPEPTPSAPEPQPPAPSPEPQPPAPQQPEPVTLETPPPATPTEPATPVMTDEEYAREVERLEAENARLEQEYRSRQSGQDRRMNELQGELETNRQQLEEQRNLTREAMIRGMPEAEQQRYREMWDLEDQKRELASYHKELDSYHADTEILHLLTMYRDVEGVTEEALMGVPEDDRELFCKDRLIEQLQREKAEGKPAAATAPTNGSQTQPSTPAPQRPVPAGASAPSDVGGAGVPPAEPKFNESKGTDAMAENISSSGWHLEKMPRRRA